MRSISHNLPVTCQYIFLFLPADKRPSECNSVGCYIISWALRSWGAVGGNSAKSRKYLGGETTLRKAENNRKTEGLFQALKETEAEKNNKTEYLPLKGPVKNGTFCYERIVL